MQEGRFSGARPAANGDNSPAAIEIDTLTTARTGASRRAIDLVEIRRADEQTCHSAEPRHADKKPRWTFGLATPTISELAFAQLARDQLGAIVVGGAPS